ncbi:MAG: hypothetical protein IH598_02060 [Bacteroidales bacterium]|nr:hypothetical protein [Bacteroidales bacterium]
MQTHFHPSQKIKIVGAVLIVVGLAALITGFLTDPDRAWANILLNNVYFLTVAIGAMMYYSIQYITQSSWSAMFQRVPLALGGFIPVAAILMLLLFFGLEHIYEWAEPGITETDKLLAHKAPYLNVPFFMIRIVIYFVLWISAFLVLRKMAFSGDKFADPALYRKNTHYSTVFIFLAVIFFSLAGIDWIMTIDAHWYSTIFGFRTMITSMYYGVATIILFIFFLNSQGYFPEMNEAHRHDLARYLFRFSIVWGYLWFMQFIITWYANIPELTVYYSPRFLGEWQVLFYAEFFINFAIPFLVVISDEIGRKKPVLISISVLLLIGLWIMLFVQIMPGTIEHLKFGFIEIGMWLGYAGLFLLITFVMLGKSTIVPVNHPQLHESYHHHL